MVNFFKRKEKDLNTNILDDNKINPVTGFEFEPELEDNVDVKPLNVDTQSNASGLVKKAEEVNSSLKEKSISEFVEEYYKNYDEKNTDKDDDFKEMKDFKNIFDSIPQSQKHQKSLDEVIRKIEKLISFEKELFEITKIESVKESIKFLKHKRNDLEVLLGQNMASGIPMVNEGKEIENLSKIISKVVLYDENIIKKGVKEDLEAQKFVLKEKLGSLQSNLLKEIYLFRKKKLVDSENPNETLKKTVMEQKIQIIK